MSKKHIWSSFEDTVLLQLKNENGIKKWSKIAHLMHNDFHCPKLTGKQCRDRFINKLSSSFSEVEWEQSEDERLMELHREYGRKWSLLSQEMKGRSENKIKNHFYARLRKSIREVNKFIETTLCSEYTILNKQFLNNLLVLSGENFNDNTFYSEHLIQQATDLVEILFWGFNSPSHLERLPELLKTVDLLQQFGGIDKKGNLDIKVEESNLNETPCSPQPLKLEDPSIYMINPPYYFVFPPS